MTSKKRTALITGASEGIGLELAKVMAAKQWDLVLVARREDVLARLAADLILRYGIAAAVLPADLSEPQAPVEIYAKLQRQGILPDALINNAGFGYYGMFAGQEWDRLDRMLQVNIAALTHLTNLFLPAMIERGSGRIINVASTASFQAVPTNAVYAATKAYVLSISEALATELQGTGVTVTCLCPGVTITGFQRVAGAEHLSKDFRGAMDAATVAKEGYRAMMQGRRLFINGGMNRTLAFLTRFAPRRLATEAAFRVMRRRRSPASVG